MGGVLEHQLGKSGVWVGWGPLPQYRHEVRQLLGNQVSEFSRGQRLLSALHRVLMEVLDESLDGSLYITEFLGILKIRHRPCQEDLPTLQNPSQESWKITRIGSN